MPTVCRRRENFVEQNGARGMFLSKILTRVRAIIAEELVTLREISIMFDNFCYEEANSSPCAGSMSLVPFCSAKFSLCAAGFRSYQFAFVQISDRLYLCIRNSAGKL